MKFFRILFRSFRDSLKSVGRNFSLSIASITCIMITLIIVGVSILVSYNIDNATKDLKEDLNKILSVFLDSSEGKEPSIKIGQLSIGQYASKMNAPHRMDLMISSMKKDGHWNCNQKCLHCYAAGQN